MAAVAIPFGLAIGLAIGMLGAGGSVLAVPVLVYLLGEPVHEATTASLVIVAVGAIIGGVRHARHGRVCWGHATIFICAALPGLVTGTVIGDAVGGTALIAGFALILLPAAAATWRKAGKEAGRARTTLHPGCPPVRIALDVAAGALVGLLTGFFGVGGGFLVVPVLAIGLALSTRLAIGTSVAVVAVVSLMGLSVHLLAGRQVDPGVTIAMAAACAAGALAGATVAGHVPQRWLGRGFAVALTAVAAYLLASATVLGGPPGS